MDCEVLQRVFRRFRGRGLCTSRILTLESSRTYTWTLLMLGFMSLNASLAMASGSPTDTDTSKSVSSCIKDADCISTNTVQELKSLCPNLNPAILSNHVPKWGVSGGTYVNVSSDSTPDKCAKSCCLESDCNYAFMINSLCYMLKCTNGSDACAPIKLENKLPDNVSMISVRSPLNTLSNGDGVSSIVSLRRGTNITCEDGLQNQCKENQQCVRKYSHSRNGVCYCKENFSFNEEQKDCISNLTNDLISSSTELPPSQTLKELAVSVVSKNVTLPVDEVTLDAYAIPQAPADQPYTYNWELLTNPSDDTAAKEGQTTNKLRLTGLKPGLYMFQVTVKSQDSNGSANATIRVFGEKRQNLGPIARISPPDQIIRLPTSSAILDASSSTDDEQIISYKWELHKGPILYQSPTKAMNTTTLQVENLIPGNYTFKLIVEDSDHVINSTTANITVIKETDYPPTANAGNDIILYLPQTEVTLNGSTSTDDKKIMEWEWRAATELNKAVDMQDTHTPYLKLSHLQVGLYQFELKVTDEAGQSAKSDVHVIVKEPSGKPPIADAGSDQTTILDKQNWMLLDGSKSKSDSNKIVKYTWAQLKGPNNATMSPVNDGVKANVSGLTKGEYEFYLEVEDDSKLTANDTVRVSVIQRINEAPKARTGGNMRVSMPITSVQINGSTSSDDVKIVEWKWEREPDSLAAGTIIARSDLTPILELTDLVPGNYVFKLTVRDEQGLTDSDIMTLSVDKDVHSKDLLEVILGVPLPNFSESDKDKVVQQLSLLLHDTHLTLSELKEQLHTEYVVLRLYGSGEKGEVLDGSSLASQLRKRLYQDVGLLQYPVVSIDTVLCLDDCSGHGICQDAPNGRECLCSAFWMENFLKKRLGNRERNCEWSKIYVGVVASLLLLMLLALVWSLMFIFRRNFKALKESQHTSSNGGSPMRSNGKRYKKQYTLLDDEELEYNIEEDDDVESEGSDSDVLFETSKRSGKPKNGMKLLPLTGKSNGSARNGILKNSRRVKT